MSGELRSDVGARHNAAERILAGSGADDGAVALRLRADEERSDVSYGELRGRVRQCAEALAALGVAGEQRVLLALPDCPELVFAFLGSLWRGAVPVVVSPFLSADEHAFFVADAQPAAIVAGEPLAGELARRCAERGRAPRVLGVGARRTGSFWRALLAASDGRGAADTHAEDAAFWLYSSGTTGRPKGVIHLHASIGACCDAYGQAVLGVGPADVSYSTSKAFFAYGLGASLYFPLAAGASVVLSPEPFRADRSWALLASERPTLFFSVPSVYRALLSAAPRDARASLGSVRRCLSAGEALPPGVLAAWGAATGREILDGLGSTEMLHIYLTNLPGAARPGALGSVVPGYDVKIVDEQLRPAGDGEPGMMLVRGPSMASGYWRRVAATRRAFQGEWYVSGDRAVRDADGGYRLLGRADDLMKIAGQWVAPGDVEEVVGAVPGVRECAVVGRAGSEGLEELVAFVVATDAAEAAALAPAVHERCAATLPRFKRPREVSVIAALPRTATGKVQRFQLRELAKRAP